MQRKIGLAHLPATAIAAAAAVGLVALLAIIQHNF